MAAPAPPAVTESTLQAVARKRIVFAHQSVGHNILDGLRAHSAQQGVALNIVETRQSPGAPEPGIFHFEVGRNEDPDAKLADFEKTLAGRNFSGIDIALVKLCYVDINAGTDTARLASDYIGTLDRLRSRHPNTRFIAVTAPLTDVQTGLVALLRQLVGKPPAGYVENARRRAFNAELRRRYSGNDLFDLAYWESVGSASPVFDGAPLETLDPVLTSDGGHLNERGQEVTAAALLAVLAGNPD